MQRNQNIYPAFAALPACHVGARIWHRCPRELAEGKLHTCRERQKKPGRVYRWVSGPEPGNPRLQKQSSLLQPPHLLQSIYSCKQSFIGLRWLVLNPVFKCREDFLANAGLSHLESRHFCISSCPICSSCSQCRSSDPLPNPENPPSHWPSPHKNQKILCSTSYHLGTISQTGVFYRCYGHHLRGLLI